MEEDIGEDFEFQVSLSSQSPSESAADRLFRSGRILPLHGLELAAESSYDGGDGGSENSKGKEDEFDKRNGEMVGTSGRKSPKMATTLNGNVMKYLIKFRSEKIRSIFMLLVKSYNNILSRRRGPNYYYDQNDHNNESIGIGGRRRMTVDIGMIKNNEIKSCPGSVSSSPIHRADFSGDVEEREISLRAAIEHCKISLNRQVL
ncbi:hypothetical protein QJS04_geneDACA015785 [Acorus gramineus]|uniref:Uncharacterized protein n=1 Tax=Acorus gramineus TaxID=55184 RepID=A0AAV9BNQ0_ACOGR|nr:hypothetical protein QJS04_geneDACA015785 [Acorus gramineus]